MKKVLQLAGLLFVLLSGTSQAALVDRGGGMIYDSDLNITWLKNANSSVGYISGNYSGLISWFDATDWAAGLVQGGIDNWRLPSIGELSGLFSDIGGEYGKHILNTKNFNYDLFSHIQNDYYWTKTEINIPFEALILGMHNGYTDARGKPNSYYAWAVRDGDVAVAAVPAPGAIWLLGSGLFALLKFRQKR